MRDLGWRNDTYSYPKVPTIAVEWPGGTHYRVNLDTQPKYKWNRGAHVGILGIDRLEEVRRLGWVLFVEGETDYAAGLLMDLPVMAVAGASTFKKEWAFQFQGCQVYVWQEPDRGGNTMVEKLGKAFWDINIIEAPPGIKDLCDLYDQAREGARDLFDDLKAEARRWRPEPLPTTPKTQKMKIVQYPVTNRGIDIKSGSESWIDGSFGFICTKFKNVLEVYLSHLKDKLLEYLKEMDEAERYAYVAACYEFYREGKCQTTQEKFVKRMHCGERGCSLCAIWLLERFFEDKGVVLEELTRPAIYRAVLGTRRIGSTLEEKERQIEKIYQQIRAMITHLTTKGAVIHAVYGIRAHIQGEYMSVEVDFLTEYSPTLEGDLRELLSRKTKVPASVERVPCEDRREAQRAMSMLMAVPLIWDSPENYSAWRTATKNTKLIQGKGKFAKVTGGVKRQKPAEYAQGSARSSCPVCRKCQPVYSDEFHRVETTEVREVVSLSTGETYLQRVEPGGS